MIISQVSYRYGQEQQPKRTYTFIVYKSRVHEGRSVDADGWSIIRRRTPKYYSFTLEFIT